MELDDCFLARWKSTWFCDLEKTGAACMSNGTVEFNTPEHGHNAAKAAPECGQGITRNGHSFIYGP
jgi:hypothetical protein